MKSKDATIAPFHDTALRLTASFAFPYFCRAEEADDQMAERKGDRLVQRTDDRPNRLLFKLAAVPATSRCGVAVKLHGAGRYREKLVHISGEAEQRLHEATRRDAERLAFIGMAPA
jgi:hypothetical protein